MRAFGNIINRVMENDAPQEPFVGMGATELCWSDRHACTVVQVLSSTRVVVTRDKATRTDANGMSDQQSYTFESNLDPARGITIRKAKDGRWYSSGGMKRGTCYALGYRSEHYDFSF